jgi:Zn-dependent protease
VNERTRQYAFVALLVAGVIWLAASRGRLTEDVVIFFAVLVPSVILHEVSHGVAALAFGDDTAKQAGRLTLNPLAHIDPLWTIILPALMILSTGAAIGMAKPVPVNPRRMRRPRDHGLLTALAGPATNVVIAVLATIAFYMTNRGGGLLPTVVFGVGLVNVFLAVFNLLPIPPLDGSALLERVLPVRWLGRYLELRRWSFLILFALFFVFTGVFDRIMQPAIDLWCSTLPAGTCIG